MGVSMHPKEGSTMSFVPDMAENHDENWWFTCPVCKATNDEQPHTMTVDGPNVIASYVCDEDKCDAEWVEVFRKLYKVVV